MFTMETVLYATFSAIILAVLLPKVVRTAPVQYSAVTDGGGSAVATATETTDTDESFWLTAELVSVEWRKGCLTTGGCAEPRFKLTETNIINNEQISISWSILNDFEEVTVLVYCLLLLAIPSIS